MMEMKLDWTATNKSYGKNDGMNIWGIDAEVWMTSAISKGP